MKRSSIPQSTVLLRGDSEMAQDITERVRAQEALSQVNRRLELALQGSDIGIWELELSDGKFENGRVIYSNAREQLGYGRSESTPDLADGISLIHPEDRKWLPDAYRSYLAGETELLEFEHRLRHQDGSYRTMLVRGFAVRDAAGKPIRVIGSRVDITERKRAEEALRLSEARFRAVAENVPSLVWSCTAERQCDYVNPQFTRYTGLSEESLLGPWRLDIIHPDDHAGMLAAWERSFSENVPANFELRMRGLDGSWRWFEVGAVPVRDAQGNVVKWVGANTDIEQRKRAEQSLRASEARLERLVSERTGELEETTGRLRVSERMAALGTLAAGLGHDMGNLLLPMEVRLGLLIEADLPRELHEHVVGIQKCARYLQRLSQGLRLLATDPAHVEMRGVTDLGKWWNDVRLILKDVLPGNIRFEYQVPESESWVGMGRTGLTQAVYNLVQNSADAIKEHGGSRVSISVESDPSEPWITIRVADDGPGMTQEVARRCMEPYFSTKARGESTGMGLSLVHALVTGAGGQVEIQSAPGQGTTFSLILPRALPQERTRDASPDMAGAV